MVLSMSCRTYENDWPGGQAENPRNDVPDIPDPEGTFIMTHLVSS